MIFNFPFLHFTDSEWIQIITEYVKGFTELPLTTSEGYSVEDLKFFDGLLGTLLKHTKWILEEIPQEINNEFVNSWMYQGKLYRCMHGVAKYNCGKESCSLPTVDYHGMITHWTTDFEFKGLLHKLSNDVEYIILETDTQDNLAFDVNKFRKTYGCQEVFTEKEREVIFPLCKENTKEYRMTIKQFVQMKQQEESQ